MATIVVVDDEPRVLRTTCRILERAGHNVLPCADGRAAIEHIAKTDSDLLVTDIFMPEMEGLETIRQARALRPLLPIIAMSGFSFDGGDYLRIAERFGATATLKKPFRRDELLALVWRLLPSGGDPATSKGRPSGAPQ